MKTSPQPPDGLNEFDARAAAWDENPERRVLTSALAEALVECLRLRPDMRLLEYGCGTATLSRLLADRVGAIDAADASTGMLEQARRNLRAHGIQNIRLLRLDLTRDEPPAERYDGIFSAMTLHHVEKVEALLRRLADLLLPGGFLAIADLVTEDGSFHGANTVPHPGFDPESLGASLSRLGLARTRWRIAHRLSRHGREYPIFLLCASARD